MSIGSAASRGRGRRWLTWARIFMEGLALGGVQLLLLFASGAFTAPSPQSLPLALAEVLSACSYLVVALIEGFLASSRTGKIRSGITAAWPVVGISVLTIAIPMVALAGITLFAPHAQCENCGIRGLIAAAFVGLVLLIGLWAWMLSTLGGWIGGIVGKRDAPQPTVTA